MEKELKACPISREYLRVLRDGLCVWNTITLDSLTDNGRKKLYKALDLIEKLWKGVDKNDKA